MPMMGEPEGKVIPFGKYRGQPVETLFADQEYLKWLLAQAWFAQQYAQLHTLVINHGMLPDETPEHNALQLAFLDDGLCLQACRAWEAFYTRNSTEKSVLYGVPTAVFEERGIDVLLTYQLTAWQARTVEVEGRWDPPPPASPRNFQQLSDDWRAWEAIKQWIPMHKETRYGWHKVYRSFKDGMYYAHHSVSLELKPSLGDDYPAVLRKMLNGSGAMLVYQHWSSQMPASQVEILFARSNKLLISLDTLRTYPSHVAPMPTEVP